MVLIIIEYIIYIFVYVCAGFTAQTQPQTPSKFWDFTQYLS